MPKEYLQLRKQSIPVIRCPNCYVTPLILFLRGNVQSGWRKFFGLPYCALICENCKEIVGYEKPERYVK